MIHLVTAWSRQYEALARYTYPGKQHYAKRWGHECRCYVHRNVGNIAWERVRIWQSALLEISEGDWIWFTGCDALITNPEIDISKYIDNRYDLIGANDCTCINTDSLLIKNTPPIHSFLARLCAEDGSGRFNNEQDAFNTLLSPFGTYTEFFTHVGNRYGTVEIHCNMVDAVNHTDVKVKIVPQKWFNTYSKKHLPGWPPTDGSDWEKTDLMLHMAAQTFEYRMKTLPNLIPREHRNLGFRT